MDPNPMFDNAEDDYIRHLEEALAITDEDRHQLKLMLKSKDATGFKKGFLCKLCNGLMI